MVGQFQFPWFGIRDYLAERQNSARIGRSVLLVTASTGPISMKISAPKVYYAVLRHPQDQ
jgi:hypothetical protein